MSDSGLVTVNVPAYKGNYTHGRSGYKISKITIHHMAGVMTAAQCGRIFQQAGRLASSNYGVGHDGSVGLYVAEANASWCNSDWVSNCQSVTIETSNSSDSDPNWPVGDTALRKLIELVADIAKRNGINLAVGTTLTWHSMYAQTTCPGNYLRSKMQYICDEANKIINGGKSANTSTSTNLNAYTNDQLADMVIAGQFGNGDARRQALGDRYDAVQAIVNQRVGVSSSGSSTSADIEQMARDVIAGKYGNGDARRQALGSLYDQVQDKVNEIIYGTSSGVDYEAIADGIWCGTIKCGTGSARQAYLDSLYGAGTYDKVQAIINKKYY